MTESFLKCFFIRRKFTPQFKEVMRTVYYKYPQEYDSMFFFKYFGCMCNGFTIVFYIVVHGGRGKVTSWNKNILSIIPRWVYPFYSLSSDYFMNTPVVEFVSFSLAEGITRELYLEKYSRVYETFLKSHPEFVSFRHLHDPESWLYANYVEWKTMEWAKRAAEQILSSTDAQDWFSLMNPKWMVMHHLSIVGNSKRDNIHTAGGLEFSTFMLNQSISEKTLLESAQEMCQWLYYNEQCFMWHQILKWSNNMYIDTVWSTSRENAKMLCEKWGQWPFAPECLNYLHAIAPHSAHLAFFDIIA